jgi:hypothetical protein
MEQSGEKSNNDYAFQAREGVLGKGEVFPTNLHF